MAAVSLTSEIVVWWAKRARRSSGAVETSERIWLIVAVRGADYVGNTKTLDVHVKRLRAKLEPDPSEPKYLVTVRGLGYKLDL